MHKITYDVKKLTMFLDGCPVAGPLCVLELEELPLLPLPGEGEQALGVIGVLHLAHQAHTGLFILLLTPRPA